jgi:hypothetical protein
MNISVALAINYTKTNISPFLKSYEKYASGILYILTDKMDQYEGFKNIVAVNVIDIIQKYRIDTTKLTPYNLKPIVYYLFLKDFDQPVENVFLTDVDVVFQSDPFAILNEIKTDTFIICEEKKLYSECDTNTTWYNMGYRDSYDKVINEKILNCGITLGTKASVQDYQKQVAKELEVVMARQPYFAYDQVILNVLYYTTKTVNPTILPHGNNYIVHLAHVDDSELNDKNVVNNQLLNNDGVPYPIVHQFNERLSLNEMFIKLYE